MRPFPWKCGTCGKRAVMPRVVEYGIEKEHDGRAYPLTIPNLEVYECQECHACTLPDKSSDKVTCALREAAGLLTPMEIRDQRKRFGLTQEQLATFLKVAKETVSRWETGGQIQQRSMDLLLRVFFGVPQVRSWLENAGGHFSTSSQASESRTAPVELPAASATSS
jgi:putative zinc finger/helix-turn-helix YgiT family protein